MGSICLMMIIFMVYFMSQEGEDPMGLSDWDFQLWWLLCQFSWCCWGVALICGTFRCQRGLVI